MQVPVVGPAGQLHVQPEEGGLLLDQPGPEELRVVRQPPLPAGDGAGRPRRRDGQVNVNRRSHEIWGGGAGGDWGLGSEKWGRKFIKGTVSQKLRHRLLYIIRKLFFILLTHAIKSNFFARIFA